MSNLYGSAHVVAPVVTRAAVFYKQIHSAAGFGPDQASDLLSAGEVGSCLLRISSSSPGFVALSVDPRFCEGRCAPHWRFAMTRSKENVFVLLCVGKSSDRPENFFSMMADSINGLSAPDFGLFLRAFKEGMTSHLKEIGLIASEAHPLSGYETKLILPVDKAVALTGFASVTYLGT